MFPDPCLCRLSFEYPGSAGAGPWQTSVSARFPKVGNGNPLQFSCLENPMDRGAWWATVHGVAELDMTERLHFHFSLLCIGDRNGNQLQSSCLENPRDGGACWAAVYGVAQSRKPLKRLTNEEILCIRLIFPLIITINTESNI